ncbi:hypothetical protein GCM10027277_12690 [Pseudoduganella ginsengisoli]|uniref:Uncharacterized protein n=1 Tax=Pseudoduganella ginsengisoli TaxID=1462440 RepID=A0A6L6PXI4_9BURK|nr:hypothetical protein [Pseudoduganella ginsengisoli]MTW01658.1 hypothetical protein [Pseudoduganella ginsengisoli]
MKRFFLLPALLAAVLAGTAHAEGNGFCKPLCETDKRECRSDAASASDEEAAPLLAMADRNPHARVAKGLEDKPFSAQVKQGYESRRVKMQRTCDSQYLRCVQACAKEEAAAPPPVKAQ